MPTSAVELTLPNIENFTITEETLTVELSDGRTPFGTVGVVSQTVPCQPERAKQLAAYWQRTWDSLGRSR